MRRVVCGRGANLAKVNLKGSEGAQLEEWEGEDSICALVEVGKIRVKEAISLISTQCGPLSGSL